MKGWFSFLLILLILVLTNKSICQTSTGDFGFSNNSELQAAKDAFRRFSLNLLYLLPFLTFTITFAQEKDSSTFYREHPLIISGDSIMIMEDWIKTREFFQLAKNTFNENKNWNGYIYALNQMGQCSRRLGEFELAFKYLSLALKEGEKLLGADKTELGRTYYYLSFYYYYKPEANLDSTFWARNKSVEVREESIKHYDNHYTKKDLAQSYHGMGSFYRTISNPLLAKDYYEKAVSEKEQISDELDLAYTYQFLGLAHLDLGDVYRAQIILSKAVNLYDKYPGANPSLKRRALNDLASSYYNSEEYPMAKRYYNAAIKFIKEVYGSKSTRLMTPLNNLGETYIYLDRPDSSKSSFNRSININLEFGDPNLEILSNSYEQYGYLYLELGKLDSASYYFKKSLNIRLEIRDEVYADNSVDISDLYSLLGQVRMLNKEYRLSLENIQKALIELEPGFKNVDITENPNIMSSVDPVSLYKLISQKARVFFLLYSKTRRIEELQESMELFVEADNLSNIIRNSTFSDQTKLKISGNFKKNAELALQTIVALDSLNDNNQNKNLAFRFIEKSKYMQVFSNLSRVQSITSANLPDSLRRIEQNLIQDIEFQNQELNFADSAEKMTINDNIFRLERDYHEFQKYLSESYPSYFKVKYDSVLLSISKIREQLDSHTQVLEYFWGESNLSILSVTRNEIVLYTTPITIPFVESLVNLLEFITWPISPLDDLEENYQKYLLMSHGIYKNIVLPILDESAQNLIISPDGPLSMLPFEALVTNEIPADFKTAAYLIKNVNIQYIYSLNLLFKDLINEPISRPSVLAFGYSSEDENNKYVDRSGNREIPMSANEVQMISDIFKNKSSKYLIGTEASESAFKELSSEFDIIHLAVHGTGDLESAINSRLEFKSERDTVNDGKLYAYELYNLNLDKLRLAVLSACESGVGKEFEGEGIFSIARGFSYAGCPSTIMSLWRVSDKHSAQLMTSFYTYLSDGVSISQSIRQAKLDYLNESTPRFALPFYWAAFVPQGNSSPIFKPPIHWKIQLMWILPLILVGIILYKRRNR